MMPEWHQLDSSCTMSEQKESVKQKTLKSSSRSFLFSTGLVEKFVKKIYGEKHSIIELTYLVGTF